MNTYKEMKTRHQEEINNFPMQFAFSSKQFEEGMQKLGLSVTDTDKIYSLTGTGGFIRKTDSDSLDKIFKRHNEEMTEAINQDKTGEGFIYDMFYYELSNHEFVITGSSEDAIDALGLTIKEVENNKTMLHGLKKAIKSQYEWYEING